MFQVGCLQHFEDDDPEFDNWDVALKPASAWSLNDNPIAIWTGQDEGSELLAIVYMQEIFLREEKGERNDE